MGESHHHHHHHRPSSRLGLKSAGGEIVQVQGGHIVRSTGRKDRHSKVCTAKGPRDRRVRLSAHTAIQFYDVQDRLGYDRPSKAVDWLIKKAKSAIDELADLPAWHPTATVTQPEQHHRSEPDTLVASSTKRPMAIETEQSGYPFNQSNNSSSFLPPSLDSDAIADTIKSFFPMATADTSSSSIHFQNYPPDLLSRTNSQSQDLRLSLQSFQDPILLHHHHSSTSTPLTEQTLFSGFDATSTSWSGQHPPPDIGRFQRMFGWNTSGGYTTNGAGTGGGGGGGFMFNTPLPPPALPPLQSMLSESQFFSQRGPLQSNNSPSVQAWTNPLTATMDTPTFHPSSISGTGFASGGFSGFRIPARIQGEEEHHDDVSNDPSSASHH